MVYCKENEIISQKGTGHHENLALRAWQAGTSDTGVLKLRYILLLPLNIELMSKMLRFPVADIYLERIQIMMVKVWLYCIFVRWSSISALLVPSGPGFRFRFTSNSSIISNACLSLAKPRSRYWVFVYEGYEVLKLISLSIEGAARRRLEELVTASRTIDESFLPALPSLIYLCLPNASAHWLYAALPDLAYPSALIVLLAHRWKCLRTLPNEVLTPRLADQRPLCIVFILSRGARRSWVGALRARTACLNESRPSSA